MPNQNKQMEMRTLRLLQLGESFELKTLKNLKIRQSKVLLFSYTGGGRRRNGRFSRQEGMQAARAGGLVRLPQCFPFVGWSAPGISYSGKMTQTLVI